MNREVHVQFCENVAVKFRCVTRLCVTLGDTANFELTARNEQPKFDD